jgi:hypothetical protein
MPALFPRSSNRVMRMAIAFGVALAVAIPVFLMAWVRHNRPIFAPVAAQSRQLGNFVAPFLLLLFRRAKRAPAVLAAIGGWLLVMHYFDVYWLLMPQLHTSGARVHWLDLATLAGVAGPALAFGACQLRRHVLASGAIPGLPPIPEPGR